MTLALYARRARHRVVDDLDAAVERDPAAASRWDLALNSPGLHAIWPTASPTACGCAAVPGSPQPGC